jgi:HlyD family secretion protein
LSDYESYQTNYFVSRAASAKAKASLAQANAQKSIAEAALLKARRNLEYCTIISPVDGVVIDRRVSVGQTVVSNQTASSIFLVARDFKKMQVWVSVNEADVGAIKPGMKVIFSCDAFPNSEFTGYVHRLRLNATLSSNVVTYIVEVNADNKSGKLIPYLTANVKFIRAERKKVLTVSNAVFRYTPDARFVAPEFRKEVEKPNPGRRVWVSAGKDLLKPVYVKTGLNTGVSSEIVSGDLKEGMMVVNGQLEVSLAGSKGGVQRSPFLPQPPQRRARTGGRR